MNNMEAQMARKEREIQDTLERQRRVMAKREVVSVDRDRLFRNNVSSLLDAKLSRTTRKSWEDAVLIITIDHDLQLSRCESAHGLESPRAR